MNLHIEITKLSDALLAWVNTFENSSKSSVNSLSDLSDGVFLLRVLNEFDPGYFSKLPHFSLTPEKTSEFQAQRLHTLYQLVIQYAQDVLHWTLAPSLWSVRIESIVQDNSLEELEKLICLILSLGVYSPSNKKIVSNILTLSPSFQSILMKQIELYRCVPSLPTKPKMESSPICESPIIKNVSPVLQSELEALQMTLTATEDMKMEFEDKYQTQVQLNKDLSKKLEGLNLELAKLRSIKDEGEELRQTREALHLADTQLKKYKAKMEESIVSKKQIKEMEAQLSQSDSKIQQLQEELSKSSTYRTQADQLKKKITSLEAEMKQLQGQAVRWEEEAQKAQIAHLHAVQELQREQAMVKELEEKVREMEWMTTTTSYLPKEEIVFSTLDLRKHRLDEDANALQDLRRENEELKQKLAIHTSAQVQSAPVIENGSSDYQEERIALVEAHKTIEVLRKENKELKPRPDSQVSSQENANDLVESNSYYQKEDKFAIDEASSAIEVLKNENEKLKQQIALQTSRTLEGAAFEEELALYRKEKLVFSEAQATIGALKEEITRLNQQLSTSQAQSTTKSDSPFISSKENPPVNGLQTDKEAILDEKEKFSHHLTTSSSPQVQSNTELEEKLSQCQQEIRKLIREKSEIHVHFRREQQLMASAWYKLQYHRRQFAPSNTGLSIVNQESV